MNSSTAQAPQPTQTISAVTLNLAVALSYCALGVASQLLAPPADYATPVWLAAGLALGIALHYGRVPYPGIFIGALAANLIITTLLKHIPFGVQQILLVGAISLASTLQTALTHYIIRRWRIPSVDFYSGSDIARFVVVAGPIGCLVAASLGTLILLMQNIIAPSQGFTNWLTWWVGDAIGTLVIAPFMLRLLSPKIKNQKKSWQSATVSLAFMALVILAFISVRSLEEDHRRVIIADVVLQVQALFASNLHEVRITLGATKSYFESSEHVSLSEFNDFCEGVLAHQSPIYAIEWLPLVGQEQRQAVEDDMRHQGFADFSFLTRNPAGTLVSADTKPDYLPILYVYPYAQNKDIHGLDVLSLAYREDQLRSTLRTGQTLLSEPLRLIQERHGQTAYILLSAVNGYQGTGNTGVVQVLFRVGDLLDIAINENIDTTAFTLTDITDPNKPSVIYGEAKPRTRYSWSESFPLGNRTLRLDLEPTEKILSRSSSQSSYLLLLGGLLYVAMLEVVMLSLLSRERAIHNQVEMQTREFAQAKEEAEAANRLKTDFLAGMSHELRTPLNAVIGFTHRVLTQKKHPLDERNTEALKIVEKNAQHLLGLINNMLDVTRIEKGKFELEYAPTCLKELLLESQDQFNGLASQKRTEIILNLKSDGVLEADPTRIRQVLMNLLSNAIKATSNGSITLQLLPGSECKDMAIPTDTSGYVVQIIDTGIGIAAEDLTGLFSKFHKLGTTSRIKTRGGGLGLALCREIIEMHGGFITARSTLHEGSTFSFWLPKSRAQKQTFE